MKLFFRKNLKTLWFVVAATWKHNARLHARRHFAVAVKAVVVRYPSVIIEQVIRRNCIAI
jgi:hypothetical protein